MWMKLFRTLAHFGVGLVELIVLALVLGTLVALWTTKGPDSIYSSVKEKRHFSPISFSPESRYLQGYETGFSESLIKSRLSLATLLPMTGPSSMDQVQSPTAGGGVQVLIPWVV